MDYGALTFVIQERRLLCLKLLTVLYIVPPKCNTDCNDTNIEEHIVTLGREHTCNLKVGTFLDGICT